MKYCPTCGRNYPDSQRYCLSDGKLLSLPDPYHFIGRTLMDKYRIDALVGIGGMGAVYGAHQLTINRRVAFKILLPNLALGNQNMLELFKREAILAGQLSHENIVDVKDAGLTAEGIAYIVMEWLEGRTLDDVLAADYTLSFERTAWILRQVASALSRAHSRQIVHRDLKPSNIMLILQPDGREQVKVLDFGIAKATSEATASPVSRAIGTPHYASPEQFLVGVSIDTRSDIYSLGIILYQMVTGRLPFDAPSVSELIKLQNSASPPPIRQYRADAPVAIEQLIYRMLAKDPRLRPQTVNEVAEIFERSINSPDYLRTGSKNGPRTVVEAPALTDKRSMAPDLIETMILPHSETEAVIITDLDSPAKQTAIQSVRASSTATSGRSTRSVIFLALILTMLTIGAGFYRYISRSAPSPEGVELMKYYLEMSSGDCRTISRGSGDETLKTGQRLKLHFIPRESGYLYIISPNERNVPMTFLTGQPDPETGLKTNFIESGADLNFPGGEGNCIGITTNEKMMAFTIIFSSAPLAIPRFLAAPAMRELTATEQHELALWRQQFSDLKGMQIIHDTSQQVSRITAASGAPLVNSVLIYDLPIKHQ